jgi:hypothetical protein
MRAMKCGKLDCPERPGVRVRDSLQTIIGPHGVPQSMVSDRDPLITARFWRELARLLGV